MEYNSPGAAMMLGSNNVVTDNCLTKNGEYGFNGYSYADENYEHTFTGGALNITFTGNDVSYNNTQKTTSGVEGGVGRSNQSRPLKDERHDRNNHCRHQI